MRGAASSSLRGAPAYDYSKLPPDDVDGGDTHTSVPMVRTHVDDAHRQGDTDAHGTGRTDVPVPEAPKLEVVESIPPSPHSPVNNNGTSSSNARGFGVLSLRRPPARRDVMFTLLFVAHGVGVIFVIMSTRTPSRGGVSPSKSWTLSNGWLAPLLLATVLSSGLAAGILHAVLHKPQARRSLLLGAPHLSALAQGALAAVIIVTSQRWSKIIEVPVAGVLILRTLSEWTSCRRSREHREFAGAEADMAMEIVTSSQALCMAAFGALALQAVYLTWWSALISTCLPGLSAGGGLFVMAVLGLDLYWCTQVVVKIVHVCVSGSVTRWFYSMDEEEPIPMGAEEELDFSQSEQKHDAGQEWEQSEDATPDVDTSDHFPIVIAERPRPGSRVSNRGSSRAQSPVSLAATKLGAEVVYHHLICSVTVSLGSVCRAALLCPVAHLLWSAQGFAVASMDPHSAANVRQRIAQGLFMNRYQRLWLAPSFIRVNHPLALVHVASYKKAFAVAARDVWNLVVSSGLDSILRTDVLYHAVASLYSAVGALTCILVILLWGPQSGGGALARAALLLLPWVFAQVQISTALEPLVATVNTCYLCYAETPELLSQTYPLIFHRLIRTAEVRDF